MKCVRFSGDLSQSCFTLKIAVLAFCCQLSPWLFPPDHKVYFSRNIPLSCCGSQQIECNEYYFFSE